MSKPDIEYLVSERTAGLPFSDAVRVGNMLYLSGQLGTGADGKLVEGGIAAEAKQTLENINATLERYGSSLDNAVKMTIFLTDMAEWADMNKVYVTFFPNHFPARSTFGVTGLAFNARIEIECVAVVKG